MRARDLVFYCSRDPEPEESSNGSCLGYCCISELKSFGSFIWRINCPMARDLFNLTEESSCDSETSVIILVSVDGNA